MLHKGFLIFVVAAAQPASFCSHPSFTLEWHDEFDGTSLDESKWTAIEGSSPHPNVDDCYGEQCPVWAGCRAGFCLQSNVNVSGGTVSLRSAMENHLNYSFTTGTIVTRQKANWTWDDGVYRLCVNAKLPGTEGKNNDGLWPAHWMLPDSLWRCDPDEGEIDIMEMVNGNGALYVDYWWQSSWPQKNCSNPLTGSFLRTIKGIPTWHSEFHEYAYEAGPNHLAVSIDNVVLANWTTGEKGAVFYNAKYYLLINTALGGEWPRPPSNLTEWPAYHIVDYVRVARANKQ